MFEVMMIVSEQIKYNYKNSAIQQIIDLGN